MVDHRNSLGFKHQECFETTYLNIGRTFVAVCSIYYKLNTFDRLQELYGFAYRHPEESI